MGTTGSIVESKDKNIEMNIEDELPKITKEQRILKKRHSSQPQNLLPTSRLRNKNGTGGMRQTASLYSIDASNAAMASMSLPVTQHKENEMKITKEQDIQALQRKEQKLDMENSRLRAELQALNKQCQKLRAERDTATERCHEATERAMSLEQDREKIQRQFKIFRETKESEIQALLQEKRKLEGQLHRMEAHGVATGDDHNFTSSAETMRQHVVIPESPTPQNQWWCVAESETTSLFGSYSQIRNAGHTENNESLPDLRSVDEIQSRDFLSVNSENLLTSSSNFGSNSMLPDYNNPEYMEHNILRCYVTGTSDCQKEIGALLNSADLKQMKEICANAGYFLSLINLDGLNTENVILTTCSRSVTLDNVVTYAIGLSDLFICFLGNKPGRFTELECQIGYLDDQSSKSALFCLPNKVENVKPISDICSSLRRAVETSKNCNIEYYSSTKEAVSAAVKEITRAIRLEFGVGGDYVSQMTNEVGFVEELQSDESLEQEQREIALTNEDDIKLVGFKKYFERLNDNVTSPGPLPPLLISGDSGSGKTLLIKSWIESLKNMQQNLLIFQHYVTSSMSITADPVILMRRLLSQLSVHLPPSLTPPSFALSSYDITNLKSSLPRWLERLSTSKNVRIVLAIDSLDLAHDAKNHFKWLLDPLPVGVRVVISVGVNSCPEAWRQWPTLHLEPLSFQSVRGLVCQFTERARIQIPSLWENDITTQCRTASTCHPLYVTLLLQVVCSSCINKKETLLRTCLKTHDSSELYKVLLKHIEDECTSAQFQQQLRQIFQLLSSTRYGLNEYEILQMVPGLTWITWLCMRHLLTKFFILTERAGLLVPHNSQISNLLEEIYIPEKTIEKATVKMLVQYFGRHLSPANPRTAKLLPWLVHRLKSATNLRECLLQPMLLHNLYSCGRASEIVEYWKYCGEDKQSIVQYYNNILQSLGQLKSPRRDSAGSSKRRHSLFPDHVDKALAPVLQAQVYESAGRLFRDLGLLEDAVAAIQRSLEIRETELDPDHPLVADSLHYLATVYAKWKKYNMAEPLLKQALELVECTAGREHPRVLQELQCLCFIAHKQQHHEQADSITKRIHSLRNRNGGTLITTSTQLDRLRRRTIKLEELALGQESINLARALNELGVLCYVQKNYSSAESFLKQSLVMREKLLGEDHGDVAQSLHNLAAVYNEQRSYEQAVECMKKALEIRQEVFGPHTPIVLSTTKHLAVLYKKSKDYKEARHMYRQLLELSEQLNGEDSSATATALVNLAVVECQLGEHERALPLYERSLAIYTDKHGPACKQVADTLRNIAVLRYERQEFDKAVVLYKESLKIKEEMKTKKNSSWR